MPSQVKQVYFNINTEKKLLDYANTLPSFSSWVKKKLREELQQQEVERQIKSKKG